MPEATERRWTIEAVQALGVTTDLITAGQVLGLSRNSTYRLARRDAFPVPIIRAGSLYRVPVAALLAVLQPPAPTVTETEPRDAPDLRASSHTPSAST